MSGNTSVLPYLQGSPWTIVTTETWTTQGTGSDNGNYKRTVVSTDTYTLTDVTSTSFTESISSSWSETETASGVWVSPSDYVKCDGCTGTGSGSSSGTIMYTLPSVTATAVTGDYTNDNIGRANADLFLADGLGLGKQVGYWWSDQNGNFQIVQYAVSGEKTLSVQGVQAKTYVVQYTGQSEGHWKVNGQPSSGQVTRSVYCDESTGVILGRHYEGTFSLQRSGGGWQETVTSDGAATSVGFKIGSYVFVDSNPSTVPINVDGSNVTDFPKLFVWDWGSSHTVTAPHTYSLSTGIRLVFTSWDDGNTGSSRTLVDKPGTYTAQFKKQYLLTASSPYGGTFGSGWYDEGSTATIHADSNALFFFAFSGWSGSSLPVNPDTQVVMTGPLTLQANYSIDPVRVAIVVIIVVGVIAGSVFYRRRKTASTANVYEGAISVPALRARMCNSCGAVVPVGARFCRKCGASQGT